MTCTHSGQIHGCYKKHSFEADHTYLAETLAVQCCQVGCHKSSFQRFCCLKKECFQKCYLRRFTNKKKSNLVRFLAGDTKPKWLPALENIIESMSTQDVQRLMKNFHDPVTNFSSEWGCADQRALEADLRPSYR
ncbi:unnamed protein product [Bursaphelenchus xylophilus]|uniref:(pine wood nematode) hypothetical protein n=1 Tax=Bursaphelenchus xylophilus TaxID=6326 RepID=A0A1I7RJ96_BURXY|nr:unnamed protein product [Bursaphelenchus xylophilus]CAG9119489.1 unnamed protein product [Bursaphelenchus xylophilus]